MQRMHSISLIQRCRNCLDQGSQAKEENMAGKGLRLKLVNSHLKKDSWDYTESL